jgi:hypothetical protein
MRIMVKAAPVVLAILLVSAASAVAADFCIEFDSGVNTIVLKAFSLPVRGTCKDYRGLITNGPYWVRGSACGSSDNTTITFFQTWLYQHSSLVGTDGFSLSRSTLAGTGRDCTVDTGVGGVCSEHTYHHVPCSPLVVPIPE